MHDRNGKLIGVGDKVMIPATITQCNGLPDTNYCNILVETDELMGRGDPLEYKVQISLNAHQVILDRTVEQQHSDLRYSTNRQSEDNADNV